LPLLIRLLIGRYAECGCLTKSLVEAIG
jgi:hypothetical protein